MADGDRHRNKLVVGVRGADEALKKDALAAAVAAGYRDLSDATVSAWRWLARRPGAEAPRRPEVTPVAAAHLLGELAKAIDGLAEHDLAGARRIMNDLSEFESDWWSAHR